MRRYAIEVWGKVNREPWASEKIVELDYDPYLGEVFGPNCTDGPNLPDIKKKVAELEFKILKEDYAKRKNISEDDVFSTVIYDHDISVADNGFEYFDWTSPENTKENWEKTWAKYKEENNI
jgi:hypothetical protein